MAIFSWLFYKAYVFPKHSYNPAFPKSLLPFKTGLYTHSPIPASWWLSPWSFLQVCSQLWAWPSWLCLRSPCLELPGETQRQEQEPSISNSLAIFQVHIPFSEELLFLSRHPCFPTKSAFKTRPTLEPQSDVYLRNLASSFRILNSTPYISGAGEGVRGREENSFPRSMPLRLLTHLLLKCGMVSSLFHYKRDELKVIVVWGLPQAAPPSVCAQAARACGWPSVRLLVCVLFLRGNCNQMLVVLY